MFDVKGDKEIMYEQEILLFDIKGFIKEESSYNTDGSLDYSIKYKYDKNYNLVERSKLRHDNDNETENYLYDKNNNLIEEKNMKITNLILG
ncbi:hypothetical protein [Aquimarina mytili]|uniref:YD repeat-containing protein n=1 Tax=Aquimarina mytili TaxID=874423 RepID=A0A937A338_9FLAO|nr:hypothetical protein [Aquimarina mytili]MBL0685981.1 hypothetical protein [Aquimarina mytili]